MLERLIGSELAARSKELCSQLEPIARKCGFILRRSRHFSASGFVLTLLQATIRGKASFNQLAMTLGDLEEKPLTKQALHKRMDRTATRFMFGTVAKALSLRWNDDGERGGMLAGFERVIVEDSSQRPLPATNHEHFPAHGNGHGETAGAKFDLGFDLKTGEPVEATLHLATTQDREIGPDLVDEIRRGDLVLRDMGYFSAGEFARIEDLDAFWLSRLPATTGATDEQGRPLEDRLRTSRGRRVEFRARLGQDGHPARLVAVRAEKHVAERRRRERREAARKQGRTSSADTLLRDGWHIMVTNISDEKMDSQTLFKLYAQRWQIEIVFRAWKQSGRADAALKRRSNPFHLECLMLASLLHLILTMKVAGLVAAGVSDLVASIEKLADSLASHLLKITHLIELPEWSADPRHLALDRRNTRSSLAHSRATRLS